MEGSYKINRHAYKTEGKTEAGTVTNLGNDDIIEMNEKHHKVVQRRFPSFTKNLYEYFVEYSSRSTIQGLSYMGEKSRPVLERLAWLLFFFISLYFCITLVAKTYNKWTTSPVLVSFATKSTAVWEIPFPAITICPDTKTRKSVSNYKQIIFRMEDDLENVTNTEAKQVADLGLLCERYWHFYKVLHIGYDTIDFLMEAAPKFEEVMGYCRYPLSDDEGCEDLFTPILTEEGICYTFNMLDRSEIFRDNVFQYGDFMFNGHKSENWTLQSGYSKNAPVKTYPRRTLSAGLNAGFSLQLHNFMPDLDYVCKGAVQGFKIILHHPAEEPRFRSNFVRAPHMQELMIAVKPDMITTSEDLRSYDPHKRQCYFPEERHLEFYRIYTQQNCEMECLTKFTRTKCGCVGFYMPHDIIRREVESMIDKEKSSLNGSSGCDCLPGCTSLVYNAETSQTDFNKEAFLDENRYDLSIYEDIQFTKINILFKEQQFITSERNELYGSTEFLSNCGGILGLFTGFSFLSLIEIIYFLSLRLFCNIKRHGRHYWSGSQDLVVNNKYHHEN